jgi:chaperonin cofactor prefoldin
LSKISGDRESNLNNRIDTVNSNLTQTINQKESSLNNRIDTVTSNINNRIDTVNSNLSLTINQKESNLNNRIDTVNSNLTQTINQQESSLNCYIDRINTDLQRLSNNITTNFDVLYEDTNQNSGRTVYLDNLKVNRIEFSSSSSSNISDIINLSTALGNLTTNFNLIYQNSNVYSDKTAYFNKVVAQNIECNNFTGVSDERLKKNIVDLKNVGGNFQKLRTVGFDWKSNNEADIGFIAQDVEKIFPSMVKTDKDGFKSVKYMNFVPILVQGYREQANEISKLKKILIIGLVVFFFLFMYKCI